MFRKIAIAGATAAVVLGAGTAALAASGGGSSSSSGTPTASSSSSHDNSLGRFARRHPGIAAAISHHAVHGVIVTKDKSGQYVTHDGILGTVSAVSSTSITVKSSDGFTQSYTVNSSTKVRLKADSKDAAISQVKVGDHVGVVGTGTRTPVATYVVDGV